MNERRARWVVPACVLLCAATCGEPPPVSIARRGESVARVEAGAVPRPAGAVAGMEGDYVIEGTALRVLVGGGARGADERGAILEASLYGAAATSSIAFLRPRLHVGARSYAIAEDVMFPVEIGGRLALRIEGHVDLGERRLRVVEELAIGRVATALSIATSVWAEDGAPIEAVRVGARIGWGGAAPFVPGVGELGDQAWHEASYLGRASRDVSTVFGHASSPTKLLAVYEQHGAALFLAHTEVLGASADVPAGGVRSERSILALARGGLGEGVRRLGWARGAPFREVGVRLPYVPDGARITAHADGAPIVTALPSPDGFAIVPLPPIAAGEPARSHVLAATAWGHAPSDAVEVGPRERRVRVEIPRGGQLRVTITEASDGTPAAARIRIAAVNGTPSPNLGHDSRAAGAVDSAIDLDGDATLALAPGRYRVVLTRGPEWSIAEETVEVTETYRPHVRAVLEHVIDPGEWVACDFHLHADPSPDSTVSLLDRLSTLAAEGIRFAVPTDHNHVTDYAPAIGASESADVRGIGTVAGVEVTTWAPHFGHFNAFPLAVDPALPGNGAPPYEGRAPVELFEALHALSPDVVIQVNHPRMEGEIGYFDVLGLDARTGIAGEGYGEGFDAVEVWNGFDLERGEVLERIFSDWLALLARGARVVATGNSDSHRVRLQWAGYPRTYVRVPGGVTSDGLAVVRALRAGRAFVTSGPFLEATIGDAGPGDTAVVEGRRASVHVRVRAPAWMDVSTIDVYVGTSIAATLPVPAAPAPVSPRGRSAGAPPPPLPVVRYDGDIDVDVPIDADTFVVVVARGERGMDDLLIRTGIVPFAFTNPIWVRIPRPEPAVDAGLPPTDAE